MNKKSKRILLFSLLLFFSIVVVALGLKYFPFTRVMKMPAGSETEFVNPKKNQPLPPHTLYYDFEVAPGKAMPSGLYKGLAHSGQYSVKAFGQNSFSVAIERTAAEVGVENLKAVALSAWVYVFPTTKEVKGNFVFTASNELGVNVCWQGIGLHDPEVPRGKWFKISGYFDLSAIKFKPSYKLQVYFWNNSHTDILIDDYDIVFGGSADRRGDTTRVDMTKPAGYQSAFNLPPFPVTFLERQQLKSLPEPSAIGPSDVAIAGNFMNTGTDGLVVIHPDGRPVAYAFCPGNGFEKIALGNPSLLASIQPVRNLLKGKFLNGQGEQIVVSGEKGWIMAALDVKGNPCSAPGSLQGNLKVLYQSATPVSGLCAGDFNGDHRSELLVVEKDGSWKMLNFDQQGGKMNVLAGNGQPPVPAWSAENREVSLTAGRFVSRLAGDQVLAIGRARDEKSPEWTVRQFNQGTGQWAALAPDKQHGFGKTIGYDTLKVADVLMACSTGENNGPALLRYNRDWRFDLKVILFSDTTFQIVSTADFHGYRLDHNPKYYESLRLVPGHFLNPSTTSLLVVGHIARERNYGEILPDFSDIYSFPAKK